MSTPDELLANSKWRGRNSLWMLWGILTFGMGWGPVFGWMAVKMKDRLLGLIATVMIVAAVLAVIFMGSSSPDQAKEGTQSTVYDIASSALLLVWGAGTIVAFIWRKKWLIWRSNNDRPWYATAGAPTATQSNGDAGPGVTGPVDRAVGNADRAAAAAPPPPPPVVAGVAVPATASSPHDNAAQAATDGTTKLDLNDASREELCRLTGVSPQLADQIVVARENSGNFRDPNDLILVAGVPIHVFAGFRDLVTVTTAGSADTPPSRRRDDLPATGRRLDF